MESDTFSDRVITKKILQVERQRIVLFRYMLLESWISVLTGFIAGTDFWHFLYRRKYQNMILLSFEHLQKIRIFPKSGGRGSKIEPAMPISILSF